MIKTYITKNILPLYNSFDKAHGVDHAQTVIAQSLSLAKHYPEVDELMIYVIAAYHDVGLCEGRERHHIVSAEMLRADTVICEHFTPSQVDTMAEAIEDHRASSSHPPRSIYGRIVAEADRVISVDTTLRRTVQYGLKLNPAASREEHYARFCDHLQEKYAEGGYLKLYIPESDNAVRLKELRGIIAQPEVLREQFDQIFNEES